MKDVNNHEIAKYHGLGRLLLGIKLHCCANIDHFPICAVEKDIACILIEGDQNTLITFIEVIAN
jgi:hypothetical protein